MLPLPMVMTEKRLRFIREEKNEINEQKAALFGLCVSFRVICVCTECVWVCSKKGLTLNSTSFTINSAFCRFPISTDKWEGVNPLLSLVPPHPSIHTDQRDLGYIMKSHSLPYVLCAVMSLLVCRNRDGEKQGILKYESNEL